MLAQHKLLPIAVINNRLTLAMVNPNNLIALDDVRRILKGVLIEPVVTSEEDLKRFMATTYTDLVRKEDEKKLAAREQAMALMQSVAGEKVAAGLERMSSEAEPAENVLEPPQSDALRPRDT